MTSGDLLRCYTDQQARSLRRTPHMLPHEARDAFSRQQLDVAERAAATLLAWEPDHAEAHRLMAFIAVVRGESTTAVEHLRSALFDSGSVAEGLIHLQQACDLAPQSPAAWYNIGRTLQVVARIPEARSTLQKAISLAPTHIKAPASGLPMS